MKNFFKGLSVKSASAVAVLMTAATAARADAYIDAALAAVDLSTVAVGVGAAAILIVGIHMAFKSPDLAARLIRKF